MELFLSALFHGFVIWCAFKFGEHMAYFRIARGLVALREYAEKESVEETQGIATIEKINDQYYAYIGNDFVAQAETLDKINEEIKAVIQKNPTKYINALKGQSVANK